MAGARRSHQPPHDRHPPHGRPPILALAFIFICLCPPGSKTAQDVSLTPVIGAKHRRSRTDIQHPKRGGGLTMVAKGWVAISNGWGGVCDLRLPKKNERLQGCRHRQPMNEEESTTLPTDKSTWWGFRSICGPPRLHPPVPRAPANQPRTKQSVVCYVQLTGSEY